MNDKKLITPQLLIINEVFSNDTLVGIINEFEKLTEENGYIDGGYKFRITTSDSLTNREKNLLIRYFSFFGWELVMSFIGVEQQNNVYHYGVIVTSKEKIFLN